MIAHHNIFPETHLNAVCAGITRDLFYPKDNVFWPLFRPFLENQNIILTLYKRERERATTRFARAVRYLAVRASAIGSRPNLLSLPAQT